MPPLKYRFLLTSTQLPLGIKVGQRKEQRFLQLVEGLVAESRRNAGIINFDLHKCLPTAEGHAEYLLYEVWRDRDDLKRQWESDFLRIFQEKLVSESLLVASPDLKFFRY
jgi:quinol monooxygenase YgiN